MISIRDVLCHDAKLGCYRIGDSSRLAFSAIFEI